MKKIISLLVLICFFAEQSCFAQILPQVLPLYFSRPSFLIQDKFRPIHLRSIEFTPQPSGVQLLLDKGDSKELKQDILQEEAVKLMDYFLIGLTLPNDAFWVNLRPDQADNIIDTYLEKTDIGKVMLEADLNLKKDLAKATSSQTREGKEYWDKLYAKAQELFGDQQVSLPTFTRPWIVPAEIIVRQSKSSAYIYKATLKVMLEQDYLRGSAPRFEDKRMKELNDYSSELIRRLIIPKLTLKVNSSRIYAPLRQVYYSLILAQWMKEETKNGSGFSVLGSGNNEKQSTVDSLQSIVNKKLTVIDRYVSRINTRDLTSLTSKEKWEKNSYFKQYKQSFQEGEYNESKIINTPYGQTIRQYTSGGIMLGDLSSVMVTSQNAAVIAGMDSMPFSLQSLPDYLAYFSLDCENPVSINSVEVNRDVKNDGGSRSVSRIYAYPAGNVYINISNLNANYIRTSEGAVSVGMTMGYRSLLPDALDYPRIIIAPCGSWVGKNGENIMQLYFSIAANFAFHKRKTIIVCRPDQKQRIIRYLELGNPYRLPNKAGYSEELINKLYREAVYLADRTVIDEKLQMAVPYPDMVEFVEFSTNKAVIGGITVTDKTDGTFLISGESQEKETVLDGRELQELTLGMNGVSPLSEIPGMGVTFLGTSNGMDPNGLPSNQIVWAGKQHILVDVNAATLSALSALGLSPRDITHIAITHLHEDHVAGILAYMEWCKRNGHPIRLLAEPGIYGLFREQAKQILNKEIDQEYTIEFLPLAFYSGITLGDGQESVLIESAPAFHGTPTMMLRFTYRGQTVSHSSDTTFDPVRFEQILENKIPENIRVELKDLAGAAFDTRIFDKNRADEISGFLLNENQDGRSPDMIIFEGGNAAAYDKNGSNHTTPFALQTLPEEIQRKIFVNHTAKLPEQGVFMFQHAVPFSTVRITADGSKELMPVKRREPVDEITGISDENKMFLTSADETLGMVLERLKASGPFDYKVAYWNGKRMTLTAADFIKILADRKKWQIPEEEKEEVLAVAKADNKKLEEEWQSILKTTDIPPGTPIKDLLSNMSSSYMAFMHYIKSNFMAEVMRWASYETLGKDKDALSAIESARRRRILFREIIYRWSIYDRLAQAECIRKGMRESSNRNYRSAIILHRDPDFLIDQVRQIDNICFVPLGVNCNEPDFRQYFRRIFNSYISKLPVFVETIESKNEPCNFVEIPLILNGGFENKDMYGDFNMDLWSLMNSPVDETTGKPTYVKFIIITKEEGVFKGLTDRNNRSGRNKQFLLEEVADNVFDFITYPDKGRGVDPKDITQENGWQQKGSNIPPDGGFELPLQEILNEKDHYKLVELSRRLGLDPRPVEYKFLHPFYIAHDMAVKKIVNPESLPFNALYFGAGVDVVNLLLSTNAVQADFVSAYNGGLTKDRLDKLSDLDINTDAQNRKKAFDYRGSKYQAGYGVGLYVEDAEDYIIYLSTELEALGVDRSMIIADTDSRGYPRIAFDWAYPGEKPRKRYVCFIDSRDILQDRGIRYLGAYDLYYQRASVELAAGYVEKRLRKNSYIRDVYARVKPGGYLVTDDYSWRFSFERAVNYADDFPEDLAVEEHFVDPLLTDTVREFRKSEGYEKMLGYGWDVGIRRKPPPAENSRRSDGGQKEAVGKDIVSVTTGLDGGTIKNTSIDRTQEQVNRLDEVYNEMLKGINLFQDTSGEAHLYTKTIEREREIILLTVEHGSKKALDLVHPYLRESALQGKFNNPDEWILLLEGLSCFEIETAYLRKAISNSGIQIKNPIVAVDTKEVMEEAARLLGVDMNELYFRFINFVRPTMIPWSLERILSHYAQEHGVNSEEMQNNFNIKKLEKKNETASQRAYYENEALQTLLVVSNKKSIDLIREQVGQKKYILIYCGMAHKQAIDNLFGENNWREITSSRKPTNIANALKLVPGVKGNLFYNDRLYLHFKAENPYRSVIFDENKLEILTIEPVSNDEVWIQAKVITSLNGEYGGVPVAKEGDVGWIKVTSDRSFNFTPDIAVQQLSKQSKDGGRLGGIDGSTDKRSPSIPQDGGKGGIDFRSLPIAIQPVLAIQPNLQVPLQPKIPLAELDKEWSSIQEMVNKGNIPSGEKIKEYVLSCCQKGDISQDMEKVLVCISQILRLEEDYAVACEPGFIQLLSILESDKPPHELQLALSAVSFGS